MNAPRGINTHIEQSEEWFRVFPNSDPHQTLSRESAGSWVQVLCLAWFYLASPPIDKAHRCHCLSGSCWAPVPFSYLISCRLQKDTLDHGRPHTQKVVPKDYKGAGNILLLSLHSCSNTELYIGHRTVVFCRSPRCLTVQHIHTALDDGGWQSHGSCTICHYF